MKIHPIGLFKQVAFTATCIFAMLSNIQAQTNVFFSAMPGSNHLNPYTGRVPPIFQYQQTPISTRYVFGVEQSLSPAFSIQLGLMRNNQKIVERTYFGRNFETDDTGHGTGTKRSLPWELFLNFKQLIYSKKSFDMFVGAGANYILQKPLATLSTTKIFNIEEIHGNNDTILEINTLEYGHPNFRPFAAHAQLGVSKRFKNELKVSAAAFFYYAPPVYHIETTIRWQNNTYQSRSELLGYFGALNVSVSYPIIRKKMHLLKKKV